MGINSNLYIKFNYYVNFGFYLILFELSLNFGYLVLQIFNILCSAYTNRSNIRKLLSYYRFRWKFESLGLNIIF